MNTDDLISTLSQEPLKTPLRKPGYFIVRGLLALLAYKLGLQVLLGLRDDLAMQLTRPMFVAEILLLEAITFLSLIAATFSMYPDHFQRRQWLNLPYVGFSLLLVLLAIQLLMPHDERMILHEHHHEHGMQCMIDITAVSIIPSALLFALIRKGASITPLRAGSYAVLTASAIGCVTLRLAEMNDSILHLLLWHYIPTFMIAILGAWIGKKLLHW